MTPGERALAHVRALFPAVAPFPDAPITVNFHPDRLLPDGRTVIEHLAADGIYRSQFETRISNGLVFPYPGGDRDRWEQRMFGGAYTSAMGRPVYGALNLAGHPDGAAPRFGSCHLLLRPHVAARATFSLGDSHTEPALLGTADTFGAIWDGLLAQVARTGQALGVTAAGRHAWAAALAAPRTDAGRTLDDYVEAQIHDGVTVAADAAAVVADPSFRGTPTEAALRSLGVEVRWHRGFRLPAAEFPADLRGEQVPPLAREIAARYGQPVLDAEIIGRAARDGDHPQLVKYLWHILVIRGRPA
ncbi:DUF3626 domain-containing protein [Actinoplanes sp. NEAU-A12]|uniref:DUF3626 domain-containing protein n=1 Tax=Actinoplanes sandaracinus TaxID=3045177 RepID=A0ABT6WZA4_9ACTN|nr:DUF3626 domain-containing protein [Actinoplanes sandaracinus]MDI6105054.1 DUF3626 domain-containing protein [Actinoplanes sandaracinus]